MCGIVALFSRRDPISEAVLQRATQSLYHRGPDGQRHWMSPDRRIALGHDPGLLLTKQAPRPRFFGEERNRFFETTKFRRPASWLSNNRMEL
jgi:hypothetical protein